jgi:DNA-binding IclR family transcriptional regulator
MSTYQEILESLERQYPGRIYLSVEQLANATGMAPGTVYNLTHRKAGLEIALNLESMM